MKNSFRPLKIFFFAFDAAGHLNACYGLAQALVQRGHKVTFLLSAAFKGQAAKFGCEEIIFNSNGASPATAESSSPENTFKDIAKQLLESGMLGPKSSYEKIDGFINMPFVEQNYNLLIERSSQFEEAILKKKPDLFIIDFYFVLPVIQKNVPFVYMFSGNPLHVYNSPKLPPGCSGYSVNSDPATWVDFKAKFTDEYLVFIRSYQEKLNAHFNYEPKYKADMTNLQNFSISPFLNIYCCPKEFDYTEIEPFPANFVQIDSFCRKETKEFIIPDELAEMPGKALIYFSMGSMGGIDVDLMKRLLAILAKTPYKYIVSKGPRHAEIELPPNCWGEQYLPQTAILPLVDLVITHGGNNSFTETFSFGKKMIVMPLFGDQYDNGTRIVEKGYGASINPYDFEDDQLIQTIDRLLADEKLTQKLNAAKERIERDQSKVRVCEAIENLVK